MDPHIDALNPAQGSAGDWILITGSGFRPANGAYIRAVLFASTVNAVIHEAEFAHVYDGGVIRDDQLRARVPSLLPGGAWVTVEAIKILPPQGGQSPKPGEIEPPILPVPQYILYRSNSVLFLIECGPPYVQLTEATMPDAVRQAVEQGILDLQNLFGGSLPVPGVEDVSEEWLMCWGYRTKDLEASLSFDSITTSWQGNLWTITLTADISFHGKLDIKSADTFCQWVRLTDFSGQGGGHRWDFTVAVCAGPCGSDTTNDDRTLQLAYVNSAFHMGGINFNNVPNWAEGGLRNRIERKIRSNSLGPDSGLLLMISTFCEASHRQFLDADCPLLGLGNSCAAEAAVQPVKNREAILSPLRSFRDRVVAKAASGQALTRLWQALSTELVAVLRKDPVIRAEAIALLSEVSRLVGPGSSTRAVPLTRERFARVERLFSRAQPRLSPVTAAALAELMEKMRIYVGVSVNGLPNKLGSWRLPRRSQALLNLFSSQRGRTRKNDRRSRGR